MAKMLKFIMFATGRLLNSASRASEQTHCCTFINFCIIMYSEPEKISIYFVFQLLRRILSCHAIANEMHDLSACTKFPDARFQLLLLIMSKIVANLKLVNTYRTEVINRTMLHRRECAT